MLSLIGHLKHIMKNYRSGSRVVIRFFSMMEIPIKHSSLCNNSFFFLIEEIKVDRYKLGHEPA